MPDERLRGHPRSDSDDMPVRSTGRAQKVHLASQHNDHNLWPFCGPNPMGFGPLTADWAEVTCKNCLRQRTTSDQHRLEGIERASRRLASGLCEACDGRPCRYADDPLMAAVAVGSVLLPAKPLVQRGLL
jgi:hypothetical protein